MISSSFVYLCNKQNYMDTWIKLTPKNLPPMPTNPEEWEVQNGTSVRVLVWIKSHDIPRFGVYNPKYNFWVIEGCTGVDESEIKFWMEISNPNK